MILEKCISEHTFYEMYKYAPAATQHTQNQIRARIHIRIFETFPKIIFGALRIFVWIPGKRNIVYYVIPEPARNGRNRHKARKARAMEQPPARHPPYR